MHRRSFNRYKDGLGFCCIIFFASLFLWNVQGCSTPNNTNSNTNNNSTAATPKPHIRPAGCHPMSKGLPEGSCLFPFPSSYYTVRDRGTLTGYRVAFPEKLPIADHGDKKIPLRTGFFNARDGFSPATPILVVFSQRVDANTLVKSTSIAKSVEPTSPVQLIEFGSGKRIPLFAEVDHNVTDDQPQVVIVRPMLRLSPKKRYAVVFLKSVKALGGKDLKAPAVYTKLSAGQAPSTPEEAALAVLVKETLKEIKAAGLKSEDVLLSWDFRTASDEAMLQEMVNMRDKMFKHVGNDGPTYKITTVQNFTVGQKKHLMRLIRGTMKVPTFLDKDVPGGVLLRDKDGKPKIRGLVDYRFQVHIPRCVKDRKTPVPVLVFGHGLFGSANGEMDSGYQRQLIDRLCMIQIGNNWIGLSEPDQGHIAVNVVTDFNNMPHLTDRLQQAHINAVAMIRMAIRRLQKEKALEVGGRNPLNSKEIYYLGISNGAIQGSALMSLTPDITRGVLNVGGGNWNMMISRSSNFFSLTTILKTFYTNPIERQLLMALIQTHFDIVDPITWAAYLSDVTRFGVPPKKLLIQEGIGDAQVPNIATRTWVRTMGLVGVGPLFEPVFGVKEEKGPFKGSAYIQYGPRPDPYPADVNLPPKNNRTHEAVRRVEASMKQMEAFLKPDGMIQQFCKGPCDPE